MFRRFAAVAFLLALLVSPCAAQSDKALGLVPEDALGFFMIKNLRSLSDKVNDTAQQLGVPQKVSMLELLEKELGIKKGINKNGSVLFILLPGDKPGPEGLRYLVALPVSDHEEIAEQLGVKDTKDGIGQGELGRPSGLIAGVGGSGPEKDPEKYPILVARRGDFVLLAPREGRAGLEVVLAAKKDITGTLKGTESWLAEQEMAGFITRSGVKFGLGLYLFGRGQTSEQQAGQLKDVFAEVEENVRLITFGGRLEKSDWRLSTAVHFQSDGSYAKWISQAEPLESKLLANFPDEPHLAVLLARVSAQTSFDAVTRFVFGRPNEQVDALQADMSKLISQVKEVTVCFYPTQPGTAQLPNNLAAARNVQTVALAQVRDSKEFLGQAVDIVKQGQKAIQSDEKAKVEFTYKEEEIAGKPSRLITVPPDESEAGKKDEDSPDKTSERKANQRGPQTFLLTALDSKTVLVATLSKADEAEELIQKYSKPAPRSLESSSRIQQTKKLLPEKLQLALYIDLVHAIGLSGKTVDAAPVGVSMRALPAGVEAQFVVPIDTMKAAFGAVKPPAPKE